MQDTFYGKSRRRDLVLRTHRQPIQIRTLENMRPRSGSSRGGGLPSDSDITHRRCSQVEGLAVDGTSRWRI